MVTVKKYKPTGAAVLFVKADWCPHCQAAKPELDLTASVLGSVLPVYEVDSERNKQVVKELGVDGYPTIFYRTKTGKLTRYTGERSGQNIVDWACAQSGLCGKKGRK